MPPALICPLPHPSAILAGMRRSIRLLLQQFLDSLTAKGFQAAMASCARRYYVQMMLRGVPLVMVVVRRLLATPNADERADARQVSSGDSHFDHMPGAFDRCGRPVPVVPIFCASANRLGSKGFFQSPSAPQATANQITWQAELVRPLLRRLGFALPFKPNIVTAVVLLFFGCFPFAVGRPAVRKTLFTVTAGVMPIVVESVDAMLFCWPQSHVGKESDESVLTQPVLADGYSPFAIARKIGTLWISRWRAGRACYILAAFSTRQRLVGGAA